MHTLPACLLGAVVGSACAQTPPPPRDWASRPAADTESPPDGTGVTAEARDGESEAAATFRTCAADGDCVAVERVGCCHNGWKVAVASSQKEAYARSFTCPDPHPMCAMYIVRDERIPRCDDRKRLCALVTR